MNSWVLNSICEKLKWLLTTPARSPKHKSKDEPHSWQHARLGDARVRGVHSTRRRRLIPANLALDRIPWSLQSDNQSNIRRLRRGIQSTLKCFHQFSAYIINDCFLGKRIHLSTRGKHREPIAKLWFWKCSAKLWFWKCSVTHCTCCLTYFALRPPYKGM